VDVDLEENRDLTLEYEINSIPHVYFFKDWEKVYDFTGVMPENEILEKIEANK
jgi:thioredoxin-like negative regulator of GroEL